MIKFTKSYLLPYVLVICIFTLSCTNTISENIKVSNDSEDSLTTSENNSGINDGPYIFISGDSLIEKTIVNGKIATKIYDRHSKTIHFAPEPAIYDNVEKIAAFSDIHGQFNLATDILKNNKIIDSNYNWIFGEGHLVVVGDIFDRGDKVTEMLWFIYNLEKQAKENGGKVHYLFGNHEFMILHNDLRYLNEKYEISSKLLDISYKELFGTETVLGRWLRSKPTIIRINDIIFVHGGISDEFVADGFDLDETNQLLRESIDRKKEEMKLGNFYDKYYGSRGPFWYRGYFEDNLSDTDVNQLLKKLNVNHIVVGHTSQKLIEKLYDGKIYGVDSSIKNGEYGEILLIDNKSFIKGLLNGESHLFQNYIQNITKNNKSFDE